MTRRLIVNADDYGLTTAVSRGIIDAHLHGIVTSTSALALAPGFEPSAAWLDDAPELGVGVHLALVGEDPPLLSAAEIPTLVDKRGRLASSWRAFLPRAAAGRIDADDVRRELDAQVERVRSNVSRPLTHFDSHQHLHLWPSVAAVVLDLARRHGVPAVRVPRSHTGGVVGAGVNRLARSLAAKAAVAGVRTPDDAAGVDHAGHVDLPRLRQTLSTLAAGSGRTVELGVHPGPADDPDRHRYRWGYEWATELETLRGPEAREAVAANGFELASYRVLATGEDRPPALSSREIGRAVRAAFDDGSLSDRLHVRVRWASCPFADVADAVPRTGRILEVGCGHGLFTSFLAVSEPDRTVVGVDLDADKIVAAKAAAGRLGVDVQFETGSAEQLPRGPWDAIVVVDVLYLLEPAAQRALLRDAVSQLAPGGVLVIKEMSAVPAWKAGWNRTQETLAVKILGITEGGGLHFVPAEELAQWLRDDGLMVTEQRLDRHYPHPHLLLTALR